MQRNALEFFAELGRETDVETSAIQDANNPRTTRGGKLEKDRLRARTSAKGWIIFLILSTICYLIVRMSEPDQLCRKKDTCECGEKFMLFFGLYMLVVIVWSVFRIKFYCRSMVLEVQRRELKEGLRKSIPIFCVLFILSYGLMLYGWLLDTKQAICASDDRYQRLK